MRPQYSPTKQCRRLESGGASEYILPSPLFRALKEISFIKKLWEGAGDMAQPLTALIALPTDPGSIPSSTQMAVHSCL